MKSLYTLVLLCLLMSCKSAKDFDIKACFVFEERYKKIEDFYQRKGELQMDEITQMIRLTGIEVDHDFSIGIIYYLTKRNLKDWKQWYQLNKKQLYWNEEMQEIQLKNGASENVIPVEPLFGSYTNKKELFSEAYQFVIIDLCITEITSKKGYYHLKGVNGKDTLDLIAPSLFVLVREKKKRRTREIKVNDVYEFDLLELYKARDFGGLLQPDEIELLTQGDYQSKAHFGPKYYRILNRYGFEK